MTIETLNTVCWRSKVKSECTGGVSRYRLEVKDFHENKILLKSWARKTMIILRGGYQRKRDRLQVKKKLDRVRQGQNSYIFTVNLTPGCEGRTPDCLISSFANMQATLVGAKSRWTVTSSLGRMDSSPCRVKRSSVLNRLWSWKTIKFI